MKKFLFAVAAVAAFAVSASAQAPAHSVVVPAAASCNDCGGAGQKMYGGHIHGGMFAGGHMGFAHGGHGFKGHMGGIANHGFLSGLFCNHSVHGRGPGQTLPTATSGTLVFPQNPFVRSPRDFFMWDER